MSREPTNVPSPFSGSPKGLPTQGLGTIPCQGTVMKGEHRTQQGAITGMRAGIQIRRAGVFIRLWPRDLKTRAWFDGGGRPTYIVQSYQSGQFGGVSPF